MRHVCILESTLLLAYLYRGHWYSHCMVIIEGIIADKALSGVEWNEITS